MTGKNKNKNKKGTLKRSEQENAKVANGPPHPHPTEDDKVLHLKILNDNLKILNDKLLKEITGVREENIVLSTNLTEMRSEIESASRMTEEWKENEKEFRKELGRKDAIYQAAISQAGKQLLEAEERFNTEISAKEDKCKALNHDKTNLEATVLQLKNQIEARSAELEETNEGRKLEKDKFLSHIAAAEKETAEISRSNQMALEAFNAEEQKLLSRIAELQTNLKLMVSEKGSLIETNRELSTEAESLKALLDEYSEKLVSMEDEKQTLEAVSLSTAERLEDLLKQNATMKKEHGRKHGEYQAAIIQADKKLLEAEERFNTEISAKGDECQAVNLDKKNLEAIVLHLKNQIEARSAELEANNKGRKLEKDVLLTQIGAAEKRIAEINRSNQMAQEAFNAEKENLLSRFAELQTNLELTVSEKGSLSETNRELTTEAESLKAHLNEYSEKLVRMEDEKKALEAMSVSRAESLEDLLKQNATMEREHGRKYGEYQAAISQAGKKLQEAEERFNTEISAKEDVCKAVNLDKKNLEATVLQLENQIEARSAEARSEKETAEITRRSQTAQKAFNAEKENLLSRIAELQKNLELMANEKQSLNETNRELKTEGESLKAQLNKYSEKMVIMEDEKQALEAVSTSKAERFEALLKHNAMMEKEISSLQQQVDENVKQHSHVIQQYKVKENSLKQHNEMLEKEVLTFRCLVEIRDKSIYERIVENDKLSEQVEELSKTIVELQEANVNVVQEKDELKKEFESLHTESVKKYKVLEKKQSELFREKEEQAKTIISLRGEINSLMESVKKYKVMEEKHSELFKEKEEHTKTINSLQGEINSLMESVKKYEVMEEKHSELLKEKEEQATTVNSLRGEINSLMESVKKYKVMEEKHSKLFKEKEEQAKTVQSLRGEINSFMEESVKKYTVMEEKHSELLKEKEEQAKTVNSLRGEINSLMECVNKYKVMEEKQSELFKEKEQAKTINTLRGEKSSLSGELKETTKKHEDFPKKCIQSQHPTITQEKRTKLLDIVNHMDVHKTPKPTKPTIVNGRQGMQEKRTSNGGHQSKAQKKPHFKI